MSAELATEPRNIVEEFRLLIGESVIGIVVGIILIVAAGLPVIQDVVDNSTATGTTRTIIDLLPT